MTVGALCKTHVRFVALMSSDSSDPASRCALQSADPMLAIFNLVRRAYPLAKEIQCLRKMKIRLFIFVGQNVGLVSSAVDRGTNRRTDSTDNTDTCGSPSSLLFNPPKPVRDACALCAASEDRSSFT